MTHSCDSITRVSEAESNAGRAQSVSAPSPSAVPAKQSSAAEAPIQDEAEALAAYWQRMSKERN